MSNIFVFFLFLSNWNQNNANPIHFVRTHQFVQAIESNDILWMGKIFLVHFLLAQHVTAAIVGVAHVQMKVRIGRINGQNVFY